jgi:hypothetical protein
MIFNLKRREVIAIASSTATDVWVEDLGSWGTTNSFSINPVHSAVVVNRRRVHRRFGDSPTHTHTHTGNFETFMITIILLDLPDL